MSIARVCFVLLAVFAFAAGGCARFADNGSGKPGSAWTEPSGGGSGGGGGGGMGY